MSDEWFYYTKARAIGNRLEPQIPADSDESTNTSSAAYSHQVKRS